MLNHARLQTPAEDGDVLIEPSPEDWPRLMAHNREILDAATSRVNGIPLADVRRTLRETLLGSHDAEPIIAAGHQPEFIHPGVWAKHVVVRHVADEGGFGQADLVVDNHAPPSSQLKVPSVNGDRHVSVDSLSIAEAAAGSAYEGRDPLDNGEWRTIQQQLDATLSTWSEENCLATYIQGAREHERADDFVDQHLAGRDALDRTFEVTLREIRISQAYGGVFVADVLDRAAEFAAAYNRSLHDYRRAQQVSSPTRPLPDLGRQENRIEAPFWIYRPGQPRQRLWIEDDGEVLHLRADEQPVGEIRRQDLREDFDASASALLPWRIRPRALTLTLWARLLLCDFFVHGIGGAKYDRITDDIMRRYYQIEPPAIGCVSATLRLPLPAHHSSQRELAAARHRLRDLHYNPPRHLDGLPEEMLERRRELIAASDALRREGGHRLERRRVFRAIREMNDVLRRQRPDREGAIQADIERLERAGESNRAALSREYFYALQPRARLRHLAERLREASRLPKQS